MDDAPAGVFVVTLEATEGGEPPPLTILAFIKADEEAQAQAVAVAEAARDGFADARVLRAAEVIDAAAMPEDFREAMAGAQRYGAWLIVYDQP